MLMLVDGMVVRGVRLLQAERLNATMVIEASVVVGYLVAWCVRKARRVGTGLDKEVDAVLDTGLERLHELVAAKLGTDPALNGLEAEATASGQLTERTRQRIELSLEEALEGDATFAKALEAAASEVASRFEKRTVTATGGEAAAIGGDVQIYAERGSAAAFKMGNVSFGTPPDPQLPEVP
jgi:hypothetical protein